MLKYWSGSKVWSGILPQLKKAQTSPQSSSSNRSNLMNENGTSAQINRPQRNYTKIGSKIHQEQESKRKFESRFASKYSLASCKKNKVESYDSDGLRKEDPLRIARRIRVDYGEAYKKNEYIKAQQSPDDPNNLQDQHIQDGPFQFRRKARKQTIIDIDTAKFEGNKIEFTEAAELGNSIMLPGQNTDMRASNKGSSLAEIEEAAENSKKNISTTKQAKKHKMRKSDGNKFAKKV